MRGRKPKKKAQAGKTRLNLRLPVELDEFAKHYAYDKNTTVTRLIVDYLTDLKTRTEGNSGIEQI